MDIKNQQHIQIKNNHCYAKASGNQEPVLLFDNRKWLGTEEAADYLRKTSNAVRILVCRGILPKRKFRRRLYFKRSDLDALINSSLY